VDRRFQRLNSGIIAHVTGLHNHALRVKIGDFIGDTRWSQIVLLQPSLEMDSDVPKHNLVETTDVEIRPAEATPPHCVDEDPGFIPIFGFFSVRPSSH